MTTVNETPEREPEGNTLWFLWLMAAAAIIALLIVGVLIFRGETSVSNKAKQQPAPAVIMTPGRPASAPARPVTRPAEIRVPVRSGDTLIGLAGRNWRQVCSRNRLPDCDKLVVPQTLIFPAGLTPQQSARSTAATRPATTPQASRSAPATVSGSTPQTVPSVSPRAQQQGAVQTPRVADNRDADGLFEEWRTVGASPLTRFDGGNPTRQNHVRSIALTAMGFNSYESRAILDRFNTNNCVAGTITAGDEFERGSFVDANGRVRVTGRVRLTDRSEPTFEVCRVYLNQGDVVSGYTLTRDITITLVRKCANVVVERRPPPPPPPPLIVIPPPPPLIVIPPPPPIIPPSPEEPGGLCEQIDATATFGFETQARIRGRGNTVWYGTASIDCHLWRTRNGWLGLGLTADASTYEGNTRARFGRYEGYEAYIGPSLHYVDDSGWDIRGTLQLGLRQGEYEQQDGFSSRRRNTMIGVGVQYNDNRYLLTGEGTETNLWGHCGIPIGGDSEEFRNGERTGNGPRLIGTCGIGGRKYFSTGDIRPYGQLNLHGEANSGGDDFLNLGARVGISAFNGNLYCGIGIDIGLLNGGINPAAGCGASVSGYLHDERTETRASQVQTARWDESSSESSTHESQPQPSGLESLVPATLSTEQMEQDSLDLTPASMPSQ